MTGASIGRPSESQKTLWAWVISHSRPLNWSECHHHPPAKVAEDKAPGVTEIDLAAIWEDPVADCGNLTTGLGNERFNGFLQGALLRLLGFSATPLHFFP